MVMPLEVLRGFFVGCFIRGGEENAGAPRGGGARDAEKRLIFPISAF